MRRGSLCLRLALLLIGCVLAGCGGRSDGNFGGLITIDYDEFFVDPRDAELGGAQTTRIRNLRVDSVSAITVVDWRLIYQPALASDPTRPDPVASPQTVVVSRDPDRHVNSPVPVALEGNWHVDIQLRYQRNADLAKATPTEPAPILTRRRDGTSGASFSRTDCGPRPGYSAGAAIIDLGVRPIELTTNFELAPFIAAGALPLTFAFTDDSRRPPSGLMVADGRLQGTPTVTGTFDWVMRVADSCAAGSRVSDLTFRIRIESPAGTGWSARPGFALSAATTNNLSVTVIDGKPALVWIGDADFATVPGLLCAVAKVPNPSAADDWHFSEVSSSFGQGNPPQTQAPGIAVHDGRLVVAYVSAFGFNEWIVATANVAAPTTGLDWTRRGGPIDTPSGYRGNLVVRSFNDRVHLLIGDYLSVATSSTPDAWESHRLSDPAVNFWIQSALEQWNGRLGAVLLDTQEQGGSRSRYRFFRAQTATPTGPADWDQHLLPQSEQGDHGTIEDVRSHHAAFIVQGNGRPAISVGIMTGADQVEQRLWLADINEPASAGAWTVLTIDSASGGHTSMVQDGTQLYVAHCRANSITEPVDSPSFPLRLGVSGVDPAEASGWSFETKSSLALGTEPWMYRLDSDTLGLIAHFGADADGVLTELGIWELDLP